VTRRTYVVHEYEPRSTGEEEATPPVSPSEPSDNSRSNEAGESKKGEIILVLPPDYLVPRQVGDISDSDFAPRLDEHPPNMRPPETLVGGVWVELRIGISVVGSVTPRPPLDRTLYGTGAGYR